MTRHRMRALKFDNDTIKQVSELVRLHLRFHTYKMGWTDAAVRRYVRDAGPLLAQLNALTRADVTTRNAKKARRIQRRMDDLEERIVTLQEQEELDAMRPPIDGNQIMAHTGMAPGRLVGDAWNWLLELRLEVGAVDHDLAVLVAVDVVVHEDDVIVRVHLAVGVGLIWHVQTHVLDVDEGTLVGRIIQLLLLVPHLARAMLYGGTRTALHM